MKFKPGDMVWACFHPYQGTKEMLVIGLNKVETDAASYSSAYLLPVYVVEDENGKRYNVSEWSARNHWANWFDKS